MDAFLATEIPQRGLWIKHKEVLQVEYLIKGYVLHLQWIMVHTGEEQGVWKKEQKGKFL